LIKLVLFIFLASSSYQNVLEIFDHKIFLKQI